MTQDEIAKRGGEGILTAADIPHLCHSERMIELLELLRDSYRYDKTITDAIERLENAVTAATASKITPSPAGSWRKAGGVLSKSQGQQ
jgi:hypothetical protein